MPEPALSELIDEIAPQLVIASGDLTHRGRVDQHDRALAFLRALGPPVLAIPGNHDIPYAFPARFTSPWAEFERCWETTEPVWSTDTLHVVGLNSVRPWRHQSGALGAAALERAIARLAEAPAGAFRIAVLLCDVEGKTYEEIAQIMGSSIGTVRSRIHRGRTLLRKAMMAPAKTAAKSNKTMHLRPAFLSI